MTEGLPFPRRLFAIAAISFGTALVVIDGAIPTVALPSIARDLGVEQSSAVLIVTIYQLVLVMTLLPFAALGDRIGHRRMYQLGLAVFVIASILCFFAKSLPFLLVVRAIQSLGAAAALSVSSAIIRAVYPPKQLGRGLGINSVIVSISMALAPTLGGIVISLAPWPFIFAVTVPFGLLSLLLGRHLPEPEQHSDDFDLWGALLCAATFGLTIAGLESAVHGDSPVVSAAIVAVGIAIGVYFVRRELRETRPIMPVDLLAQPVFALSVLGALCAFVASMTFVLSMPFRLEQNYGFGPAEIGAMLAPWPLTIMIVAPTAGALSDRIPAGVLGGIGMSIATVALLLLAWLPAEPDLFDIAWRMALCGAGFGLFLSPNARLVIGSAPRDRAASAGGLVSTVRMTGQTLGATLFAALLALSLGSGPIPAMVAAGLAFAAGLCSVLRLNPALRKPPAEEVDDSQPGSHVR